MLFPNIAADILETLMEAEEKKKPITLAEALRRWGQASTWEDLVDGGYIYRRQEAVTVTEYGKKWRMAH